MKEDQDEAFYVGYLDKAPAGLGSFLRKMAVGLIVLMVLVAAYLVINQKGFSNATYELGTLTELEGVIMSESVPMLKVIDGKDIDGNLIYKNIVLINFGKFGADELLTGYQKKIGKPFNEVKVKLIGTLIYRDGVTLFELTKMENSMLSYSVIVDESLKQAITVNKQKLGKAILHGEIIDPKCYFGAMKPGYGKPHRSCAIRCISGGIPPVLKVTHASGKETYYLLRKENGDKINEEVLPFVADPVQVTGRAEQHDEWNVLYVSDQNGIVRH